MEMDTPDGFALMNWETGYGDWVAEPVWDTLRVLPWLEKTALVLADATDGETGEEIPVSPRTILKRQVERAADLGLAVKCGSELEYYVLKDSWESLAERGWPMPKPFGYYNEDYQLLQATKAEPLHRLLRNQMTAARIPIEFSKGEAANGQHEVNIRYDHVLESADRTVIFKHGAKEIAYLNGWGITFMAKPDHRWTGSSGHLHMSLWDRDDDRPLMHAAEGEPEGPYGLGERGAQFVAGMMALSRELAVFIAPFVNSYKRYASLSWAPVNVVWGRDNRTTGFRLVGNGGGLHVENRFPGGDMNAYLTYAAMIGAGPVRDRARPRAGARVQGQRLRRHRRAADAARAVGGDRRARAVRRRPRDLRRRRGRPLPERRARRAGALRLGGPQLGSRALPRARVTRRRHRCLPRRPVDSGSPTDREGEGSACPSPRPTSWPPLAPGSRISRPATRSASARSRSSRRCTASPTRRAPPRTCPTSTPRSTRSWAASCGRTTSTSRSSTSARQTINFPYYVDTVDTDIPDPAAWEPIGEGNARGSTAYVLRTGRPTLITPAVYEQLVASGEVELVGVRGDGDWLGVPLSADGRTLGVLVVQGYSASETYTETDRDLLAFVGQHVGIALSRVRAIEETRQRNAELAIINEIGDALASQLDFQAIIDLVGERVRELFDSQSMFIALYDEPSGRDHLPLRDRRRGPASRATRSRSARA